MNDAAAKWIKGATTLAAVAVGGVVVYKLYQAYAHRKLPPAEKVIDTKDPSGPKIVAIRMPGVTRGENLSTKTEYIINARNPSYKYARVLRSYKDASGQTVYDFKSPIDGFFTDKLLSEKGKLWAEIRPA